MVKGYSRTFVNEVEIEVNFLVLITLSLIVAVLIS